MHPSKIRRMRQLKREAIRIQRKITENFARYSANQARIETASTFLECFDPVLLPAIYAGTKELKSRNEMLGDHQTLAKVAKVRTLKAMRRLDRQTP